MMNLLIGSYLRTIDNLKANNEDGQYFVVEKIKEIVEDPEWWFFSCVCGHPIVGDDNVFYCQLCSREIQHFMIRKLSTDTVHSFFINCLAKKLFSKFKQRGLVLMVIVVPLKSSMSLVMHDFSTNFRLISASRMLVLIRPLAQYLKTFLGMDSLDVMRTKSYLVFE
ncbi:uncharacterized protein LOC110268301 isoform X1 [Arachis ipaensis]|uniref:uncharacterized protein LOC110268301 isoform X1 n=1 Tax=Arachis ipaensis TaxID=130454 RepID=UPI000A2B5B1F|nr:uncharacterized protein LOC110268301 isoform X1 [Arachis ipaensis]XP_020969964.1 uncharacterized protein LOC110268301 isoform X1 [Arachis ipaensis]